MKYLRVNKKDAEKAKQKIIKRGLLDRIAPIKHSTSYVYFPISISKSRIKNVGMKSQRYDILGNIAVMNIKEKRTNEKAFAKHIMSVNKNVKTVLARAGAVKGKYRKRNFRYILGKKNYIAEYKENNCTFVFDVRKTYFSNRLSYERSRINSLVKDKETIMVMFAGVGPFAIEIAKCHPKTNVIAIELNRYAYNQMLKNIKINKTFNVKPILGDVKKIASKYKNSSDRIIMPLPQSSSAFIGSAITSAKRKAVIHLYIFGNIESAKEDATEMMKKEAKKRDCTVKVLASRLVRNYSAREIEIAVDFLIKKK